MLCGGNQTEYCGGANRLDMYQVNASLPTPSTTTTAGPSATTGPVVVQTAGSYVYIGCYTEGINVRALIGLENPIFGATTTVEKCAAACVGYTYFGVEYADEWSVLP